MAAQSVSSGRVVISFNLQRRLAKSIPESWEEELEGMLARHINYWENVAGAYCGRVSFSSRLHASDGTLVWFVTELSERCTRVILSEDY